MIRRVFVLLLSFVLFGCSCPKGADSPEGLAKSYVMALARGDAKQLRALIHPACTQGLSQLEKRYLDYICTLEPEKNIPDSHTIEVHGLGDWTPPAGESEWRWPVTPTKQIGINWDTGEYSSESEVWYVAPYGDKWFLTVPFPTGDLLRQYVEHFAQQK